MLSVRTRIEDIVKFAPTEVAEDTDGCRVLVYVGDLRRLLAVLDAARDRCEEPELCACGHWSTVHDDVNGACVRGMNDDDTQCQCQQLDTMDQGALKLRAVVEECDR